MAQGGRRAVILHNVRSVHNVGAIFRTADAIGVSKIYLSGYTPLPMDRFGRERKDLAKTALGAQRSVPWEEAAPIEELLRELRADGYFLVAVEQSPDARDYKRIVPREKTAVVFGNEIEGLSHDVAALCDVVTEIPMRGRKESLNVAVAAGIMLYRLFDQ